MESATSSPSKEAKPDADRERSLTKAPSDRSDIQGIVLAGVHDWGECLLHQLVPRPLLPIAGRPLLLHILDWLRSASVWRATICANSDTTQFRRFLGAGGFIGMELEYYEDVMPRGPGGCVHDAVLQSDCQTVVAIEGTILPQIDLNELLGSHWEAEAAMTVVASSSCMADAPQENPMEPLGIYIFSRAALEQVPAAGYQDIKEMLIPRLYGSGQRVVARIVASGGTPRVLDVPTYMAMNARAVREAVRWNPLHCPYRRIGESAIHNSARVAESARLLGPVLVGPECVIGDEAVVSGPTVLGPGSAVGAKAVVSRAVVWSGCVIGGGAVIDRSVLADGAEVEPGTVVRDALYVSSDRGRLFLEDEAVLRRLLNVEKIGLWERLDAMAQEASRPSRVNRPVLMDHSIGDGKVAEATCGSLLVEGR